MIAQKKITEQSQKGSLVVQLGKIQPPSLTSSQSGFTIMECLMAVVVVSVLMAAIAPVIALAVSTRVQSRRVELATQAARAYIDGVTSGAINAPNHTVTLDEVNSTTKAFESKRSDFSAVAAPTGGSLSCADTVTTYPYCSNPSNTSLYCFDFDRNGCSSNSNQDLIVQAFRSVNSTSTDATRGYLLGVRVYRANGFSDSSPLTKGKKQATFTGGLGDRKAPLVELTTEIVSGTTTLQNLCDRLGGCTN